MKKLFLLAMILFLALSMTVYAQSGKEDSGAVSGHGAQHQTNDSGVIDHDKETSQKMDKTHMMNEKDMHRKMSSCISKCQRMMENMHKMMGKEMSGEHREKMADMMKNMSKHMMDMSMMMGKGHCSMEEMNKLDKDISDTEKSFEELENFL